VSCSFSPRSYVHSLRSSVLWNDRHPVLTTSQNPFIDCKISTSRPNVEKDWEIIMNCELPHGICLTDKELASGQRCAFRITWTQRRNCRHANELVYLRERRLHGCYVTSTTDDSAEMYTSTTEWAQRVVWSWWITEESLVREFQLGHLLHRRFLRSLIYCRSSL